MKQILNQRKVTVGFEMLEDRRLLAQFGIAWDAPMHLSLSLVPDQTAVADLRSNLFSVLDSQMPRRVWQSTILRAAQAWMDVANVNIGLVSDGGQRFGAVGPTQGDGRFGDLRIGGYPMHNSVMAISIPPGSTSGTFTGDIFFNTAVQFTPASLEATALHEFGHALGLGHSDDPLSVMYAHLNHRNSLAPTDVSAIRSLYGARSSDSNEFDKPNNTLRDATRIKYSQVSSGYNGTTPVVEFGDITTPNDVDYLFIPGLSGYSGPMTILLKSDDISLMTPKITVMERNGRVLAQKASNSAQSDTLRIRLANTVGDERYYIRVESNQNSRHRIGRYSIAVTFDGLLQPTSVPLNTVMKGNYESLSPEKIDELFKTPNSVLFENDLHLNDTIATASDLRPDGGDTDRLLNTQGTLHDSQDVDVYRVRTPSTGINWVMTATVLNSDHNPVLPRVSVLNANGVAVAAQVIANGNGTFSVQATGLAANRSLYLRVSSPTQRVGNYVLNVSFGYVPAELTTFATGQIDSPTTSLNGKLYVARPQLFNFALAAEGLSGSVTMVIRNSAGAIVEKLTARAQDLRTSVSRLFAPGEYSVSFTATVPQRFSLRGSRLSDPLGPVIDSTILNPVYVSPTEPDTYVYPDGHVSLIDYYWLVFVLR